MNLRNALALSLLCTCFFGCTTSKAGVKNDDEATTTRNINVPSFTAIDVTCVGNVYFTQNSQQNIRVEGTSEYVKGMTFEVKNDELCISSSQNHHSYNKCKVDIYITAPDMKSINISGVGKFDAKYLAVKDLNLTISGVGNVSVDQLKCNNLTIDLGGVGNVSATVNCAQTLKADVNGVGNLTLIGYAAKADITKSGIGKLNVKELKTGGSEKQNNAPQVHFM